MKVTACTNCSVLCTVCQPFVLSPLTLINLNFKLCLIRINFLPRSSELQVLGNWRRSLELLVFRVFGTWSSESSSLQKLEKFIRTSCLQNLQHLIRNTTSEAGTVHQNFLSQNLQLGFWANYQSLQKLTWIRRWNSVFRSASECSFCGV